MARARTHAACVRARRLRRHRQQGRCAAVGEPVRGHPRPGRHRHRARGHPRVAAAGRWPHPRRSAQRRPAAGRQPALRCLCGRPRRRRPARAAAVRAQLRLRPPRELRAARCAVRAADGAFRGVRGAGRAAAARRRGRGPGAGRGLGRPHPGQQRRLAGDRRHSQGAGAARTRGGARSRLRPGRAVDVPGRARDPATGLARRPARAGQGRFRQGPRLVAWPQPDGARALRGEVRSAGVRPGVARSPAAGGARRRPARARAHAGQRARAGARPQAARRQQGFF